MKQEIMGFWDAVASAGPYAKQFAPESRQITTPTPYNSIFTGQGPDLQNILRFIIRLS